jgi:hypothetical protein
MVVWVMAFDNASWYFFVVGCVSLMVDSMARRLASHRYGYGWMWDGKKNNSGTK